MSANTDIIESEAYPATAELDLNYMQYMAMQTGVVLRTNGYSHTVLEPGDGTRYEIIIVRRFSFNDTAPFMVASNLSSAYPWMGKHTVYPSYAIEKWSDNNSEWTGTVMALFLNWVADWLVTA